MLILKPSTQFKKDIRRLSGSGSFKMDELKKIITGLQNGESLDYSINRPHKLAGNWKGYMECHIKSLSSDWLLIYRIDKENNILYLARTGTHADLFK